MRILNLGSLNIDNVYAVDRFLQPGETKLADGLQLFCGGKGLNQSIAAARAGNEVWHAGLIGEDGAMLRAKLEENGVNTSLIRPVPGKCGHAIIQVDRSGQNCILLYGGTNRLLTEEIIDGIFDSFGTEGAVLLQNEVNLLPYIIEQAYARALPVFFNAAPMDDGVLECPLRKISWLIVNELEGAALAGGCAEEDILSVLREKYPETNVLLTLGARGAVCRRGDEILSVEALHVPVKDTTAAGDTFSGYFMYGILSGWTLERCLQTATMASALCVGREGAADSVPRLAEIEEALEKELLPLPRVARLS